MQVESSYTTSQLIGTGPRGKAEVHRKLVDEDGRDSYTVEVHPFFSYSAAGYLESVKEVGKNVDKLA
jgi:hypothetical protein